MALPAGAQQGRRATAAPIRPGVPLGLARARAACLSDIEYDLRFSVPDDGIIRGEVTISFTLGRADESLQIDFAGRKVLSVERTAGGKHRADGDRSAPGGESSASGGNEVPFRFGSEHIMIGARHLETGRHSLRIVFIPDETPLHRERDYLYSLFVPAKARFVFPCFDQPDLKASFGLTLEIPGEWVAVSNAPAEREDVSGGRRTVSFGRTKPLSTYVFSFAAGAFHIEEGERGGRTIRCYHLEGDSVRVERNMGAIFDLHAGALDWMERYTGIAYPYGKLDFAVIPSFPYSGMEHAGAILYRAERLFLEENATERELLKRASLVSHETAHMWFGDLVTMTWFDDVWLKEAFAQFMADRIVEPAFPDINHRLLFVASHFDPLYAVERTQGTHPIRQKLANLDEAGSLYGNIIYHKPPVVLNQLESLIGGDVLRTGLRCYLRRFSNGNAAWEDLVGILDSLSAEDLAGWSRTWVMERGRPKITAARPSPGGCAALVVHQDDPLGRGLLWPQRFELAIHGGGGERVVPVFLKGQAVCFDDIPVPEGAFILPNAGGGGFGYFELDSYSRALLGADHPRFDDPVRRAVFVQVLRENLLEGALDDPVRYLDILAREIEGEDVEINLQLLLDYLVEAFWSFLPDAERMAAAGRIESLLLGKISAVGAVSMKSACFKAYRSLVTSEDGISFMRDLWKGERSIEGLPLSERDHCDMALELAARGAPGWREVLDAQAARIADPALGERFAFVRRAASPERGDRDRFYEGLAEASNRRHEPWVLEALYYLHHPVHVGESVRYVREGLRLLEEIHRTGDIFFPRDWTAATLSFHASDAAAEAVRAFLGRPVDPERLRLVVIQASDRLFRANRIRRRLETIH